MTTMRLRVQFTDAKSTNNSYRKTPVLPLKFVYVFHSPSTKTINELIDLLEKYIIHQYSNKNIQIVRLMTEDGYFLSNDDLCSNVLQDNDRIICYDMENFIQDNYPTLDLQNLWSEIEQHDASDNQDKYIQIGLNNLGKLFIRIRGTSSIYALHLFNVFQLIKIAQEKPANMIITRVGEQKWFIEAKWAYDSISNTSLFLICNLKIGSSEQIWSNKLQILLDESRMCIEKGEMNSLSGENNDATNLTDEQRERLTELAAKISPPKYTGPTIDIEKDAKKNITKHECEGESFVRMAYGNTNTVTASQDYYSSEKGTFRQHFVVTHINFFKQSMDYEKPLSVLNVNVFYQREDETWSPCEDIAIGTIVLRNAEPSWLANLNINIEPDQIVSYGIKGWIEVHGQPGKDNAGRRRMHKSLPQPLKLKIVIEDNLNKQCSLIVEQLNKPLEYDTAVSYTKSNQSSINDFLGFIYADDCEIDERSFIAIYLNKENQLVIHSGHHYSIGLERKNIRTMEFKAKQNNTIEVLFDSIYYQHGTEEKKATALFDPETFLFYAVRVEISTKTSRTEETILLPIEKIK